MRTTTGSAERGATGGRRVAIVTVHLVLSAALAACGSGGGGGGSRPTPTAYPSATPFVTATPLAPTPTPTSTVLPNPFPIAENLPASAAVEAAWGGERFLVTFSAPTDRQAPDVLGVRLAPNGEVVDSAPLLLNDLDEPFLDSGATYLPGGIAFAGDAFGVFLWGYGTRGDDGPPAQVVGFVSVPPAGAPALPATTIDEQLTFSMALSAINGPVAASTNGTLFLGMYQRIVSLAGSFSLSRVGGRIVTRTGGAVQSQPVGPLSAILPPPAGVISNGSAPAVATRSDGTTLVAFTQTSQAQTSPGVISTNLQGALLTSDGQTLFSLSDAADGAGSTAVASDGTSFLVVWETPTTDDPDALTELRAIRYTPGADPEPAGGFVVAGGSSVKHLGDVAFAGGTYLITWIEADALRGARLGSEGTGVAPLTIDAGPGIESVALATDGARFLAVFDRATGASSSDVLGTFVELD
ncbi:MAG: hypothetical protein FJ148_09760 [Deltaproteobacteria bacterium]|nr:hypothetical protein [Deltaproteobacteria bacterium]